MKLFMLLILMSVFVWHSYPLPRRHAQQRSRAVREIFHFDAQ
jgi:hypothetical protein